MPLLRPRAVPPRPAPPVGRALALLALWAVLAASASAQTGKISGTVTDAETGLPVPGAQILIEELRTGGVTTVDGEYTLLNVRAGTYTLLYKFIGYADVRLEGVVVRIGQTTTKDVALREEGIVGEEVVVYAEEPLIEPGRTTTSATVTEEQLEALPVLNLSEVIDQQAGVVDGRFRGGRAGEVAYLINGVPINNPYDGSASFEVEQNMVSSLQVISGVFNAEYGQALSGVVNVVTKAPPREWTATATALGGQIASARSLEYVERTAGPGSGLGRDDFQSVEVPYYEAAEPIGRRDLNFSLGGPVVGQRVGVRMTARYFRESGHLIGRRLFAPGDSSDGLSRRQNDPESWLIDSTGDQSFVPNATERYSVNPSVVADLAPGIRFDYNLFWQQANRRDYSHGRRYVPDGTPETQNVTATHIAGLRLTVGPTAFANVSYSYLSDRSDRALYDVPGDFGATGVFDPRYAPGDRDNLEGSLAFDVAGNDLQSRFFSTRSHSVVADYSQQIGVHLVKAGVSGRLHTLDNQSYAIENSVRTGFRPILSPDPFNGDTLRVNPREASAYIQDQIELNGLIVNAGLRFDLFDPSYVVPVDWSQAGREVIADPDNPGQTISNRVDAPVRTQLSPRFGVAFPISAAGVLRFSAGLFFQTPTFDLLYRNANYEVPAAASLVQFGNVGLEPERTLSFEVGLQQGLTDDLGAELTVFSKDIRNLTGVRTDFNVETAGFNERYINRDFGTVRGITASLFQRGTGPLGWSLDYTLQFAEGSSSDADQSFELERIGEEITLRTARLNWDRRHTLNGTLTYAPRGGPFSASLLTQLLSGLPYTTERAGGTSRTPNNADMPARFVADLRLFYRLPVRTGPQLFVQVDNLFDARAPVAVDPRTGRADDVFQEQLFRASNVAVGGINSIGEFFAYPQWYAPPRYVSVGIRVGS